MIRDLVEVSQDLVGDGARHVSGVDPLVDALTIIGDPGGQRDRIFHQIK
jgi:hypothetical protein